MTEVPVEEEVIPEEPEIIEINVPKEEPVAFGDEVKAAPVIPKEAYESVKTPANNLDPDIDTEEGIAFPNEEAEEQAKELKREQKRRQREDKLAQKEAKRKEKLDKKKKVRRTDFKPGSDIDLFPEDDE